MTYGIATTPPGVTKRPAFLDRFSTLWIFPAIAFAAVIGPLAEVPVPIGLVKVSLYHRSLV